MPPTIKKLRIEGKEKNNIRNVKEVAVVSNQLKKQIEKKEKNRKKKQPERGVLFIKHLPKGFFEEQLKKYFHQFGRVTRVRLVRSVKTGNSKGYAFIEFAVPEVAKIAAETMNNYLMFQKLVKASYIPPEEQKYNYFRTSIRKVKNPVGKVMYVSASTRRVIKKIKEQNMWTEEVYKKRAKKSLAKIKKLKTRYANLEIDFNNVVATGAKSIKETNESDVAVNTNMEHKDEDNTHDRNQDASVNKSGTIHSSKSNIDKLKSIPLNKKPGNPDSSESGEYVDISKTFKPKKLVKSSCNENKLSGEKSISKSKVNSEPPILEDFTSIKEESITEGKYVKIEKPTKLNKCKSIVQLAPCLGGVKKSKIKLLKEKTNKKIFSAEAKAKKELKIETGKGTIKSKERKLLKRNESKAK